MPQQRSPTGPRTGRRQGFRWQALIWRQGKSWGNISFAAGWRPTPPVLETWPWLLNGASVCRHRPADQGVGTGGWGGGEASHTMSLAERQGPPSHTPGPRPESFRPEEPSSPSSPAHLEATPQSQPVEGSQRSQARPAGPGSPSVPCLRSTYVPRPGSCQAHATGPLTPAPR